MGIQDMGHVGRLTEGKNRLMLHNPYFIRCLPVTTHGKLAHFLKNSFIRHATEPFDNQRDSGSLIVHTGVFHECPNLVS